MFKEIRTAQEIADTERIQKEYLNDTLERYEQLLNERKTSNDSKLEAQTLITIALLKGKIRKEE